jgi:hypothetical protein
LLGAVVVAAPGRVGAWGGVSTGEVGTSLKLGSRSRLVLVDPPRARCRASRSAGDGANARIVARPERKPGLLPLQLLTAVVLPLALSLLLLLPLQ